MADIAFYHLTESKVEQALPLLLIKTLAAKKRALICCAEARFNGLSQALWQNHPDSWLPHGIRGQDDGDTNNDGDTNGDGDPHLCPIWLTHSPDDNANGAEFLFLLDGIAPKTDTAERVFILFDGGREGEVATARQQWKALNDSEHQLSYWRQNDKGAWQKG